MDGLWISCLRQFELKLSELPDSLHDGLLNRFQHSMICLAYSDPKNRLVTPCGSGTLVRSGAHFAILTAAHVVQELQSKSKVGLFLRDGPGFFAFDKETVDFFQCPGAKHAEIGPDIGFLRIPSVKVGAISAVKSFIDLDAQLRKIEKGAPAHDDGIWCTTGFPEALGGQHVDGEILRTRLFGFMGVGLMENFEDRGEFDYCTTGVDLTDDDLLPDSFTGMSGGGLWQVTLRRKDGTIEPIERYLSGVVYYQTAIKKRERFIKCHGRKSIYEYVLPNLINRNG